MRALILVEHDNFMMHPATRQVLNAVLTVSRDPILLVVGFNCETVANEVAHLEGVGGVWHVEHADLQQPLAEVISALLMEHAKLFDLIAVASTTYGKNILPRLSAMLDVAMVSDVIQFESNDTVIHPIYAGNALESVQMFDPIKLVTIRTTAFSKASSVETQAPIEKLQYAPQWSKTTFLKKTTIASERPRLSAAKIVVSGGRGLQSKEQFKLVESLADTLGAAVGASRAAVDAGFVSNDYQVGQTGQVVAPDLYIALGISGAVQHLAGMKDSKVIVAVNKDPDAPIFQMATYGLVGDVFEVVPKLIEQLKE